MNGEGTNHNHHRYHPCMLLMEEGGQILIGRVRANAFRCIRFSLTTIYVLRSNFMSSSTLLHQSLFINFHSQVGLHKSKIYWIFLFVLTYIRFDEMLS